MVCSIKQCGKPIHAKGFCSSHYAAFRNGRDVNTPLRTSPGVGLAWIKKHKNFLGTECLTWPFATNSNGYAHLGGILASRIMCELVHGKAPSRKHEAAHSCGKGHEGCIHPKHIRWATRIENINDRKRHGTDPVGIRHPAAKLNDDDVRAIRALRGKQLQHSIAADYGVVQSCVSAIINRRRWKHIP